MASSVHVRTVVFKIARLLIIFSAAFCTSKALQAKNTCPWINEATASGLLGADSIGEFTEAKDNQPPMCLFTQRDATGVRTLRITVTVTPDYAAAFSTATHACGPDAAPIQAIGNQAIMCIVDSRTGALGQQIIGRVRDQIFTIAMVSSGKGDLILTRPALKSRIYTAAEQVAGNLF